MTEMEPSKIFEFSETTEIEEEEKKPAIRSALGFPYIPPNDNQETVLQMLKREKEEDQEFRRMIVLQEERRLAKNPHLVTGTFGPGTGTKSLYEKIQDLLKDYYYPENEFNSLKLDVILAEKQLEEAQEELQKAENAIAGLESKQNQYLDVTTELHNKIELLEKELLDSQMPEYEKLYVSGEEYKKLSCEKWLVQEEQQEVKDKLEQIETEMETIGDRKEELEKQLIKKENEQQNLEKQALEEELKEAQEKIALLETEVRNLKTDGKENNNIFGKIMGEVLKEITGKNLKLAWLESEKARESWSIYIEPNDATDARFRSLKELFTEHCHTFCFVKNGKTNNISWEIQLKKTQLRRTEKSHRPEYLHQRGTERRSHREMVYGR